MKCSRTYGTLEWDADVTIRSSDWNGGTASINPSFTFLPTAQNQYAALFNKNVEIIVTDARTVDNDSGKISWFSNAATSKTRDADNTTSNSLITGEAAKFFYKGTEEITDESKLVSNDKGKGITSGGLGYTAGSYSFASGDVVMTYELPFTVGDSAVTLSEFSYKWGCLATNNFNGTVSVYGNNDALLYTQSAAIKSNEGIIVTLPIKDDKGEVTESFSVNVPANTTGKIVIKITATGGISNKSNNLVIAESSVKFSK